MRVMQGVDMFTVYINGDADHGWNRRFKYLTDAQGHATRLFFRPSVRGYDIEMNGEQVEGKWKGYN